MYDKKHPQWIVYQNHSGLFNYFLFNSTSANFDANDFIGIRKVKVKSKIASFFKLYIFLLNYNTAHCAK